MKTYIANICDLMRKEAAKLSQNDGTKYNIKCKTFNTISKGNNRQRQRVS